MNAEPTQSTPPTEGATPSVSGAGVAAPPWVALAIATGFGAGFAPVAPGTCGALLGVALFVALISLPVWLWVATALGLCALGIWAAELAELWFERKDDARIVIDEVAGQLIALAPLIYFRPVSLWGGLVTGFVAFRVFDIWKPGPVRLAERSLSGGVGVMADDVVAGVMAASILVALAAVGAFDAFDGLDRLGSGQEVSSR